MSILSNPLVWPSITEELAPFLKYCRGIVLNAGSGQRDIQMGKRDLNIDIVPDNKPDIIADLHGIPLLDESVDTIVSVAVLEHTRYPWIVAEEFYRVLRPGGYGVIGVPFLQPQHACPSDYVRFTENGLVELMKYVGFEVIETSHVHHFGQTVAWMLWEYLQHNRPQKFVEPLWVALIHQLSKGKVFKTDSPNTHNTHYVVVQKPGDAQPQSHYQRALAGQDVKTWFFPMLACPESGQTLRRSGEVLVSEDGFFSYAFNQGIPEILPKQEIKTSRLKRLEPFQAKAESQGQQLIPQQSTAITSRIISEKSFDVSFKTSLIETLHQARPKKVAVLATSEYEGIFRNGGVGTHYKTLSDNLAADGWYVILLLCFVEEQYGGHSDIPALKHIFSTAELQQILHLQPTHLHLLADSKKDFFDHQGVGCLLFMQALANCLKDAQIYVEFPEMMGIGYRTIQAKQAGLLGTNCVTAVTMHSGHEWVYEANEKYIIDNPSSLWQVSYYEQYCFENADLVFFPSNYLKAKVETYGWKTTHAKHMPYFVPIVPGISSALSVSQSEQPSLTP